jgi:hypothetical protein
MMFFANAELKQSTWRSLVPYSLSTEIAHLVDFVVGVHHFPTIHKSLYFSPEDNFMIGPKGEKKQACEKAQNREVSFDVFLLDLRTRYNVTDFSPRSINKYIFPCVFWLFFCLICFVFVVVQHPSGCRVSGPVLQSRRFEPVLFAICSRPKQHCRRFLLFLSFVKFVFVVCFFEIPFVFCFSIEMLLCY